MEFEVRGTDQKTGQRRVERIHAQNVPHAASIAEGEGVVVTSCVGVEGGTGPTAPLVATPSAEQLIGSVHPPFFRSQPASVLAGVLFLPLFGFGVLILLACLLKHLSTTLTVTTLRTSLRRGILSKRTSEVRHADVRNVRVTQGILDRMLGVGRLEISSAGQADMEISVSGIANPEGIKMAIDRHRQSS